MITRLKVKNYRSIEEIDLPLSPLTVLVGKNGAGKSTILDVLAFVRDALSENLAFAIMKRGSMDSIVRWTSDNTPLEIEIFVEFVDESVSGSYSFSFGKGEGSRISIKDEECSISYPNAASYNIDRQNASLHIYFGAEDKHTTLLNIPSSRLMIHAMVLLGNFKETFSPIIPVLTNTGFYDIIPDNIRKPQIGTNDDALRGDGSNIGEVLSLIAKDECERERFCEMLGYMVRGVEDLRVTEAGGYFITELKHHQKEGKSWFNLAHESEGTLKALAFLAAIYQEHTHSLIALEEPDANLYYRAIGGVMDTLREGILRRQIIVTTQSPDLLAHFGIDEIRVVEKVNGVTKVGMLEEAQRKAVERKLFSVPELLRMEDLHRDNAEEDEESLA